MLRRLITLAAAILSFSAAWAQINVDQVVRVGRNALYFEDYVLSIQYFNQAIEAKPYLARPYFYRALAKYNLDDMQGAEADATLAIERNPFIIDAYELRGVARHNLGNPAGAIADYEAVLDNNPRNQGVLLNLAIARQETGDTAAAATTFADLIRQYPAYDRAHLGLARLELERGDTLGAIKSVDKALQLNKYNVGGYVTRAEIYMNMPDSLPAALAAMDEAIRLDPHTAGFFINRAFMRYRLDDYYGAMSDYDYALQLDRHNPVALYNRALLRMEVGDYDRAVADLNDVIALKGRDYRALYNRALVNKERGDYRAALADADAVIEAFPDLAAARFLRFDIYQAKGDRAKAKADYDMSLALARRKVTSNVTGNVAASGSKPAASEGKGSGTPADGDSSPASLLDTPEGEEQDVVAARFTSLLTVDSQDATDPSTQYGGSRGSGASIRGRVQDVGQSVELEPIFIATYYTSPTELKPSAEYLREVDDVNRTRALRMLLQVTNHESPLTDQEDIRRHFESVDYYTSYISTHSPRAIDFFARGMDFMTVRDYQRAVADFTRAIELTPDFTLALLMRSAAEARAASASQTASADETHPSGMPSTTAPLTAKVERESALRRALADIDRVIELSPTMALAYYNKGVLLAESGDYTSAIAAFSRAIELKPALGEAFYNRGFCYFRLGNSQAGSADLSRAGELGIVGAYSLLKRMR